MSSANSNEVSYSDMNSNITQCIFCNKNTHNASECPVNLLNQLYLTVPNKIHHERVCWRIITSFTVLEIKTIYTALHNQHSLVISEDVNNENIVYLVSQISNILLNEMNSMERRNANTEVANTEVANTEIEEITIDGVFIEQNVIEDISVIEMNSDEVITNNTIEPNTIEELSIMLLTPSTYLISTQPQWLSNNDAISPILNINEETEQNINFDTDNETVSQIDQAFEAEMEAEMEIDAAIDAINSENEDPYDLPPPLMDLSGNIVTDNFQSFYSNENIYDFNGQNHTYNYLNYDDTTDNTVQIILNQTIKIITQSILPFAEEASCPICYENYENNNIAKTECGHCFCFKCVKIFTKHQKNCPMCRAYICKINAHTDSLCL
jgi:hypothetical protein